MNNYLLYLLESSICLALFYGVYHFALRKDSFHNLLRIYILFSIVASLAIPRIPNEFVPKMPTSFQTGITNQEIHKLLPAYSEKIVAKQTVNTSNEKTENSKKTIVSQSGSGKLTSSSIKNILCFAYFFGIFLLSARFLFNIFKIVLLIKQNEIFKTKGLNVVRLKSDASPFSFLHYIFLPENSLHALDERQIIEHERIHVKQLHTLDILFIELVKTILWFNPFIWLFKTSLIKHHEFFTDEQIIKHAEMPEQYKELLLTQHLGNYNPELVHSFSSALLKNRIAMMSKSKSSKIARLKLAFVLPVVAIGLYAFTKSDAGFSKNLLSKNQKEKIEKLISYYEQNSQFNGNILISRNGEVAYQKSHGYADFNTKRELNINTPFRLGAVTEPFTAVSIMILKEQGKLNYTNSLSQYFTDLPAFMGQITIHQLLNNTSGIPPLDDYWPVGSSVTDNTFIYDVIRNMDMLYYEPGTKYGASSSGYVLLGLIIEKVSGQSYQQFVQKNILSPARMKDTYFLSEENFLDNNRAIGYHTDGKLFEHSQFTSGNTGIISTVYDLHKFEGFLYSGNIINSTELNHILNTTKLENDNNTRFGYGFQLFGKENEKIAGRYSWFGGTKALLFNNIESKNSIIALTNNSWPQFWEMIGKISRIIENKPYHQPVNKKSINASPDVMHSLAGKYERKDNKGYMDIKLENDTLFISNNNFENSFQLFAETLENFFIKEYDLEFVLEKTKSGVVSGFTMYGDEGVKCVKIQ